MKSSSRRPQSSGAVSASRSARASTCGGQVVVDHGGVGAGGGPGDQAEGNGPGTEQDAGGNQEDAGSQALSESSFAAR